VALSASPDISQLFHFAFQQGQPADPEKSAPQGTLPSPAAQAPTAKQEDPSAAAPAHHSAHLTEGSRVAIIRAISGEFVRAQIALPGGKEGYHLAANEPKKPSAAPKQASNTLIDSPHVFTVVNAPVIHQGDKVQITRIEFREKSIVFDLNGGGKHRFHLREHLQLETAGPVTATSISDPNHPDPAGLEGQGSTLFLDFGGKLPDLSPEELKQKLAPVLDFRSQRSAAAQFAESLPPEFQQAIKNRTAAVGMDQEMVLAAMGRPDRKVRERDEDGNDTEDWIYGTPPGRTIFVTFVSEKVVRVRQFN
jgi:hypothetical protein